MDGFVYDRAHSDEAGRLKVLWHELFPEDSGEYIDLFFDHRFDPQSTRVIRADGEIIAVAYLLECEASAARKVYYGYAGGMDIRYRGRGIFRLFVNEILSECREKNRSFVIFSAPGLERVYAGMGIGCVYNGIKTEYSFSGGAGCRITARDADSDTYIRLRDSFFSPFDSLVWDKTAVEYAITENRFCGGVCSILSTPDGEFLINAARADGMLTIEEHTLPAEMMQKYADAICSHFGAEKITVLSPANSGYSGEKVMLGCGTFDCPGLWVSMLLL